MRAIFHLPAIAHREHPALRRLLLSRVGQQNSAPGFFLGLQPFDHHMIAHRDHVHSSCLPCQSDNPARPHTARAMWELSSAAGGLTSGRPKGIATNDLQPPVHANSRSNDWTSELPCAGAQRTRPPIAPPIRLTALSGACRARGTELHRDLACRAVPQSAGGVYSCGLIRPELAV